MAGLLNQQPDYLPFSSVGPRTQKVLARAQNAAYEPYQEAEQQGNPWINYNPLLTLDSMYRAGQEGIGETVRQIGDAWGYPSQGKEAASGVNSGLEYLASRGGSDFSTPGFGVPLGQNPAKFIDVPKTSGALAVHGGIPHEKWDFSKSEGPGMWLNDIAGKWGRRQSEIYAEMYAGHPELGPRAEVSTYELPPMEQWLHKDLYADEYPPAMREKLEGIAKKNGWELGDPYDDFWSGIDHGTVRKDLSDAGIPGWWGIRNGHDGDYVALNPDSLKKIGRFDVLPRGQDPLYPNGRRESTHYKPYIPEDIDFNPYKHLLSAGALSTQDAPLSFPRRR